jgi:benzoyl-CoA reductase/2-hydroxyglutaryl-CoA dehydratase subunit BcrC/BadD/HgdB
MNILPVEIWDPPLESSHANAHLQSYICSVVKQGLELILQGKCRDLDAFLFPHTCDSIQNLASIVNDYLGIEKPCYFFYHPKAPYKESSRWYYIKQLEDLALRLEKQFGPLNHHEFKKKVEQGEDLRRTIGELYRRRAEGTLGLSNVEFYRILRQVEYLHPDDFLPVLTAILKRPPDRKSKGLAVIVSGILPNPPEVLEHLDRLGINVADDDFLSCSRRLLARPAISTVPFEAMADSYFGMQPCCTKGSAIEDRLKSILDKAKSSSAKGVIFQMVKFCEPELFDVPILVEGLKAEGLATLVIDTELNQGMSGQLVTRLEAFAEMIG